MDLIHDSHPRRSLLNWDRLREYLKRVGLYTPLLACVLFTKKLQALACLFLFGNANDFWHNVHGRIYWNIMKRNITTPLPVTAENDPDVQRLKRDKYVMFAGLFDPGFIHSIRAKFDALIEDPAHRYSYLFDRDGKPLHFVMDDVPFSFPEVYGIIHPKIRAALSDYYGTHFKIDSIRAWRNLSFDPQNIAAEAYSNRWHYDRDPVCGWNLFYYVRDVDETQGPFTLMNHSESKKMILAGYYDRDRYQDMEPLLEDRCRRVPFTGLAGSVAVANVRQVLHRASVPEKGKSRDVIQLVLMPSNAPFDVPFGSENNLSPHERRVMEKVLSTSRFTEVGFPMNCYSTGEIHDVDGRPGLAKLFQEGIAFAFFGDNSVVRTVKFAEMESVELTGATNGPATKNAPMDILKVATMKYITSNAPRIFYFRFNGICLAIRSKYRDSVRAAENTFFIAALARQFTGTKAAVGVKR